MLMKKPKGFEDLQSFKLMCKNKSNQDLKNCGRTGGVPANLQHYDKAFNPHDYPCMKGRHTHRGEKRQEKAGVQMGKWENAVTLCLSNCNVHLS